MNPRFDTGVAGWRVDGCPGCITGSSVLWSSEDANGSPSSGSAAITALSHGAGIWQVVRVVEGESYDLSAKLNVESPPGGDAWMEVRWTDGLPETNYSFCHGSALGRAVTRRPSRRTPGRRAATVTAPAGAGCGVVRVAKSQSGVMNPHRAKADDVDFRRSGKTGSFHTLTPCRLVDTRTAPGVNGGPALASLEARNVLIAGNCGVPVGATAVAANLTAVAPMGGGHLKAYPAAEAASAASALNFNAGVTRANLLVLTLGPDGWGTIKCEIPGGGSTHVLLDVAGYFQ